MARADEMIEGSFEEHPLWIEIPPIANGVSADGRQEEVEGGKI